MTKEQLNTLGYKIIGAAIEVHKELGAGLLESVYETCLVEELRMNGIKAEQQVPFKLSTKGKNYLKIMWLIYL